MIEDRLKRKEFAEKILKFLANYANKDDGFVTVLSGKFGSGKSTLFSYINDIVEVQENIYKDKFRVVMHDCWSNNFFGDPLIAILNSLSTLKPSGDLKTCGKRIVKALPKILNGICTHYIGADFSVLQENIFDDYNEYKLAIAEYKEILKAECAIKPVILLIDELDRCLPEYQIKTLEIIHHILGIKNLTVIIAIDTDQLSHSISNIFGNDDNVLGYLNKFVDYTISLNDDIYDYLEILIELNENSKILYREVCVEMYKIAKLQLRDGIKLVNQLNMLIKKKLNYFTAYPHLIVIANLILILKHKDYSIFKKYFSKMSQTKYEDRDAETNYDKLCNDSNTLINNLIDIGKTNFSYYGGEYFEKYFKMFFNNRYQFELDRGHMMINAYFIREDILDSISLMP